MSPTSCHCSTPRRCASAEFSVLSFEFAVPSTQHPKLKTQNFTFWMAHGPTLPAGIPPVPSALPRFTTRFGMERGGSTAPLARHWLRGQCRPNGQAKHTSRSQHTSSLREALVHALRSPPRLTTPPAPAAHPVISGGTYLSRTVSAFILRRISHLDAFSGSCCRP